jgi:hypothetical protein
MKKLLTICLLIAISFTAIAQQLSTGIYTVSISKLIYSNISGEMYGKNIVGHKLKASTPKKRTALQR